MVKRRKEEILKRVGEGERGERGRDQMMREEGWTEEGKYVN